ncbi:MAG: hypothetical protein MK211_11990 [Flavobacteriales bacterium]|nr:hypothetical protein [Flavobacteriales bacterium]
MKYFIFLFLISATLETNQEETIVEETYEQIVLDYLMQNVILKDFSDSIIIFENQTNKPTSIYDICFKDIIRKKIENRKNNEVTIVNKSKRNRTLKVKNEKLIIRKELTFFDKIFRKNRIVKLELYSHSEFENEIFVKSEIFHNKGNIVYFFRFKPGDYNEFELCEIIAHY